MKRHPDLTPSEISQLEQLKLVADNPDYSCMWREQECARLVEAGYARRHETYAWMALITPEGRAALARLERS